MEETWLPVVGYEGYYEVSDLGRVRSIDRIIPVRGVQGRRRCRGTILTLWTNEDGYLSAHLNKNGNKRTDCPVHGLVLTAFVGRRPPGLGARHLSGDRTDARLSNLAWSTQSENMYDRGRHGTDHELNKTHCPRDHPLQSPNLQPTALRAGRRSCYACTKARGRIAYALKKQGLVLDFKAVSDVCYAEIMTAA